MTCPKVGHRNLAPDCRGFQDFCPPIQGVPAPCIPQHLSSSKYFNRAESRKCSILGALDWLRTVAGDLPDANSGTRHVEALMAKMAGPTAANTVEKNLSISFNFAIKW